MIFKVAPDIEKWMEDHGKKCKSRGSAGEHWEFVFLPTGLVEIQTIKCICCGKEKTVRI